ncbi:hypothetical protein ACP70R_022758 [Stipagrostis hirtigluma subsp. patula]
MEIHAIDDAAIRLWTPTPGPRIEKPPLRSTVPHCRLIQTTTPGLPHGDAESPRSTTPSRSSGPVARRRQILPPPHRASPHLTLLSLPQLTHIPVARIRQKKKACYTDIEG